MIATNKAVTTWVDAADTSKLSEMRKTLGLWTLEYKFRSDKKAPSSYHIDTLPRTIARNRRDYDDEVRTGGRWMIVFIGAHEDCWQTLNDMLGREVNR